jgi:transposase
MAAWPEIQILFMPKYACWLNLIEPWWKQLKSLALQGHKFETRADLEAALWGRWRIGTIIGIRIRVEKNARAITALGWIWLL